MKFKICICILVKTHTLTAKSSQWDVSSTHLHQTIHYLHHTKTIPLLLFFKRKEERAWSVISDAPRHRMKGMAMHLSTLYHRCTPPTSGPFFPILPALFCFLSQNYIFILSPCSLIIYPDYLTRILFFFRVFLPRSMLCNLLYRTHTMIHVKMSEFHSVIRTTLNMFLNIVFSIFYTIEFFIHTSMIIFFFTCLWKTNS